MNYPSRALLCMAAALCAAVFCRAGDWTWTYSVQVHANVQASPARITLHWPADQVAATSFSVWRKTPEEKTWGARVALPGHATSYVDDNVSAGQVYEYQIEKETAQFSAWGYIAVGINAPMIESRGKVILVVDNSIAGAVSGELRRLERDLVGDGWGVIRKEVSRGDSPQHVRNLIRSEWEADRANVRAVFLFGRVPVPKSGRINPDGHGGRPYPADVYYGEMDGHWSDHNSDGVLDQYGLPSDLELDVGRVDFANMPGAYASGFPSEVDLLRRYLDKDHAFRHARVRPPARALVGNVAGDGRGQAYAASGYRTFAALVGPENVVESGTDLTAPVSERWITKLTSNEWLWTYASGAGSDHSLGVLGTHGQYNDVWGSDLIDLRAKATFYMLFGSWISEWDKQDNFMRSALAAPDHGLTAVWSGRPHFYFHHMGTGQTIGHSVRLSQNNNGHLYRTHIQRHARGVHMALLGDPTLRTYQVAPPSDVRATVNGGEVAVTWSASPDSVFGYRVYRSNSPGAPFERVSGELHTDTRFVDRPPNPAEATYMVRAVALHLGPSGSFYNPSQGAFSRDDFSIPNRAPHGLNAEAGIGKVAGHGTEVGTDIRHPNGNIFDQVLLQGTMANMSADGGQVLRTSLVDPDGDIIQVEFSGSGRLSLALEDASGPSHAEKYNQDVSYMRGRVGIVITGADANTHLSVFSVGRATAVNQTLFRDTHYDGIADIAYVSITSLDGRFGGLRLGNTRFSGVRGLTGIYASDIQFTGSVVVGDIDAQGSAMPVLLLGAGTGEERTNEVSITGGDLQQSNGRPVAISGITRLHFVDGMNSHSNPLPAQPNRSRIERNGIDVTSQVVSGP